MIRKIKMSDIPVKSVKKACDILAMLNFDDISGEGLKLSAIAKKAKMPVNTAHNILKTLTACGFAELLEYGVYTAGQRCREIRRVNSFRANKESDSLKRHLFKLANELNENVVLTVLADGKRVVLGRAIPDEQVIRIDDKSIKDPVLYSTPTGRLMTAFVSKKERDLIFEQNGKPDKVWPEWEKEIREIRESGYVMMMTEQITSFAVPLYESDTIFTGALGCHAPTFRCGCSKAASIVDVLRRSADDIGRLLGQNIQA